MGGFFSSKFSLYRKCIKISLFVLESTFNCNSLHERVEQRKIRVPWTRVIDCHGQEDPHQSRLVALKNRDRVVCTFAVLEHGGIAIRCAQVYLHMRIVLRRYETQQQSLKKKTHILRKILYLLTRIKKYNNICTRTWGKNTRLSQYLYYINSASLEG